jgi:allantoicase
MTISSRRNRISSSLSRRFSFRGSTRPRASGWTAGNRAAAASRAIDWCIVQLGMRGIVHGVNVDTQPFHRQLSVALLDRGGRHARRHQAVTPRGRRRAVDEAAPKRPRSAATAKTCCRSPTRRPWTHVRLSIYPEAAWRGCASTAKSRSTGRRSVTRVVDLALITKGGLFPRRERSALRHARRADHARPRHQHG